MSNILHLCNELNFFCLLCITFVFLLHLRSKAIYFKTCFFAVIFVFFVLFSFKLNLIFNILFRLIFAEFANYICLPDSLALVFETGTYTDSQ